MSVAERFHPFKPVPQLPDERFNVHGNEGEIKAIHDHPEFLINLFVGAFDDGVEFRQQISMDQELEVVQVIGDWYI